MYCIKCGVELGSGEKQCPLCGTLVFHPQFPIPDGEPLYPADLHPIRQVRPLGMLTIVSMILFLLPMLITFLCDLQLGNGITWSGYVIAALLTAYVILVLPRWFHNPNPVIFVPISFVAIGLLLLYIDLATAGGWFLSFALPVTAGACLIVTTAVTLTRYIHRGRLYIFGGISIVSGLYAMAIELLLDATFGYPVRLVWSLYPLSALSLLGLLLLMIAVCRPLRESLGKRLFL